MTRKVFLDQVTPRQARIQSADYMKEYTMLGSAAAGPTSAAIVARLATKLATVGQSAV